MAEAAPAPAAKAKKQDSVDSAFQRLMGDTGKKVSNFAAFFFIMLAFGAILGICVMMRAENMATQALLALLLLSLVAYYHRAAAIILFLLALAYLVLAL